MPKLPNLTGYSAVSPEEPSELKYSPENEISSFHRMKFAKMQLVMWTIHGILLLGSSMVFLLSLYSRKRLLSSGCNPELTTWSSSLAERLALSPTKFDGSFQAISKFSGPPNPQVDLECDRFTANPWIDGTAAVLSVTKDDVAEANKIDDPVWFNSTVKLDEEFGGGYMATFDMFHQLHCLNMLRKVLYRDYYENKSPMFAHKAYFEHMNHCVEAIRQTLMCAGNTELILFHWVKDWPGPVPDFNVWHQCRDPEAILTWATDNAPPISRPFSKPQGVIELALRP